MDRIRWWIVVTLAWLLVFFNIERFHEPINLASFLYVLATVVAAVVVAWNPLAVRPWATAAISLVLLFCLKWSFGYAILGKALPLTVTEACALLLTGLLARQIAVSLLEFQSHAADAIGVLAAAPSFEQLQPAFYREVRRARRFERPLVMVAVTSTPSAYSAEMDRVLADVQSRARKRYLHARLANLMVRQIKDSDQIAYDDDQFVVMLPETGETSALRVAQRLRNVVRQQLGLDLRVGVAAYPEQAETLDGLLERSQQELLAARAAAERQTTVDALASRQPAMHD